MPVAVSSRGTPGMLSIVYWSRSTFLLGVYPHANFAQPVFVLTTCNDFAYTMTVQLNFFRSIGQPGWTYESSAWKRIYCEDPRPGHVLVRRDTYVLEDIF